MNKRISCTKFKCEKKEAKREKQEKPTLTLDEIIFAVNPKTIVFKNKWTEGEKFLFCKSLGFMKVDNNEDLINFMTNAPQAVKRLTFGRLKSHSKHNLDSVLLGLIEELVKNYDIKNYILVPGYYKNTVNDNVILVSENEFFYDFPELKGCAKYLENAIGGNPIALKIFIFDKEINSEMYSKNGKEYHNYMTDLDEYNNGAGTLVDKYIDGDSNFERIKKAMDFVITKRLSDN